MTRVGLVVHAGRVEALKVAGDLARILEERGVTTRALAGEDPGASEVVDPKDFPEALDLIVSVGGDGTFLRAAHLALRADRPVAGVKVGRMGFLTEYEPEDAAAMVEEFLEGKARIEERLAVVAEPEGTPWKEPQLAINEVMLEKRARHRVIRLAVFLNDEYVTTFSGDGVIVATPTGSTAYSFSARGPIVSPTVPCLVVTPVAAHMVFDRSFVLSASESVSIEVRGEEPGVLSADGREGLEVPVGARIRVRAAGHPARLVRRSDAETFYRRVRDRFHLPDEET